MVAQIGSSSSEVEKPEKDNNLDIWTATLQRCKSQLPPKDLQNIVQIRSHDQLIKSIGELKQQYQSRKTIRALNFIEPVIQNLRSFNGVIDTAIQSNPDIAALCWGGLKLIIEVVDCTLHGPLYSLIVNTMRYSPSFSFQSAWPMRLRE